MEGFVPVRCCLIMARSRRLKALVLPLVACAGAAPERTRLSSCCSLHRLISCSFSLRFRVAVDDDAEAAREVLLAEMIEEEEKEEEEEEEEEEVARASSGTTAAALWIGHTASHISHISLIGSLEKVQRGHVHRVSEGDDSSSEELSRSSTTSVFFSFVEGGDDGEEAAGAAPCLEEEAEEEDLTNVSSSDDESESEHARMLV